MRRTFKVAAAGLLATTMLTAPVWAQSETTEPDCPEDMDTEPGCDMTGADSEPGPVEGAATANAALTKAKEFGLDMPITKAVDALVQGRIDVQAAIDILLTRPQKEE